MKWTNKGHQYDMIGEKICALGKKRAPFFIWGAGTFGIAFFELFCKEIEIIGFIDSDPLKWGQILCNVPVYSPNHLKDAKQFVLVSSGWTKDIYDKLEELGYSRGQDYLHIDDFTSLYYWYQYRKVYLSDITYMITERCSLRCEKCNAFIPKISNPVNFPIEFIERDFEQFFACVDNVNVLGLSGGDAMMHPQFADILESLVQKYYPSNVSHFEVYSNAVIIPDQRVLQIMKKYDVFYRFSDYRPYTEGRQKVEEVISFLLENGIRYDHVRFESWRDCGYPQESNGIQGQENLIHFFDACDRKSCHRLYDGSLLYCGMAKCADRIDYCKLDSSDVFDLTGCTESKRIELIEYMLGYSEKGYMNYCQMCSGGFNINDKLIEAGKQLK